MQGKGEFTKRLEELGILHIKAGIRKPTTTGKIERWHRTLIDEFLVDCEDFGDVVECLPNFLEVYNTIRPHEALDYEVPLVRYLGSLIREESI
jgi:transposase InsO family protein